MINVQSRAEGVTHDKEGNEKTRKEKKNRLGHKWVESTSNGKFNATAHIVQLSQFLPACDQSSVSRYNMHCVTIHPV